MLSLLVWLASSLVSYFLLTVVLVACWQLVATLAAASLHLRPARAQDAVLITGATSGIGLAVAKHLYKCGYSVIVGYLDAAEPGHAELRQLVASGSARGLKQAILFVEMDVRSEESIKAAYSTIVAQLADRKMHLYALINNAGLGSLQPFAWLQRSKIRNLIETNLTGCLLVSREFLPLLVQAKGRLLMVSSGLGIVPGATYATYGATKSAQIYLTKCLNLELASRYGVQCVAVLPHNLIKNTNICATNVKTNELAWQELKPLERELYASEFREHSQMAVKLEEGTKELANRNKSKTGRRNQASANDKTKPGPLQQIARPLMGLVATLTGKSMASTIEESGALRSFELALRLHRPPEVMFAGNKHFNLVVSSLLLSLPQAAVGLLGRSVGPSLYE